MNLYKVKFKENFKKEQDFMFDVANESELFFKINNLTNKDLPTKRKIVFRDPEDVDEHTWK